MSRISISQDGIEPVVLGPRDGLGYPEKERTVGQRREVAYTNDGFVTHDRGRLANRLTLRGTTTALATNGNPRDESLFVDKSADLQKLRTMFEKNQTDGTRVQYKEGDGSTNLANDWDIINFRTVERDHILGRPTAIDWILELQEAPAVEEPNEPSTPTTTPPVDVPLLGNGDTTDAPIIP